MGRSKGPRGFGRRRRGGGRDRWADGDDRWDDADDELEAERPGRDEPRGRGPGARRGGGGPAFDWDAVDETEASGPDWQDDDVEDVLPERTRRRPKRARRLTLIDLCTPVLGYASLLAKEPGAEGAQPSYDAFREQVLAALRSIEEEAPQHGIEAEDAAEAVYALSLYIDGQVNESSWAARDRWAAEPLHVVLHQDPAGGVNFFRRLEELGDRQRAVKEVYLVCLALGFRGKYAELEPTEQATQIGALKQRVLREVHPRPLDQRRALFPEAYREAEPIVNQVPPPPRWWLIASLSTVAAVFVVWLGLFWFAGILPDDAADTLEPLAKAPPRAPVVSEFVPDPMPETGTDEAAEQEDAR